MITSYGDAHLKELLVISNEELDKDRRAKLTTDKERVLQSGQRISAQTLHCQKLESLGYIFVADRSILIRIFTGAPKDARVLKRSCIMTLQGHPKSLILGVFDPNRKRVYDFLVPIQPQ